MSKDFEGLLVQTLSATTAFEIDKLVNAFRLTHDVKFVQSHVTVLPTTPLTILHTYICYYKGAAEVKVEPKESISSEDKPCPKCHELIGAKFKSHFKCGWRENGTEN